MLAWASARVDFHTPFPKGTRAIGVARETGEIIGVVAFHSWNPWNGTMEVSAIASDPRWTLAREAWAQMFDYVFRVCDCQKVWSQTPARNARALRFLRAVGFHREAILPRQFGDDDAVISSRFREEYYGQQSARRASAA